MEPDYLEQFQIEGLEEYSPEAVKEGFKRATQKACRRFFRTSRCNVDMYNKVVTIDFVLPKDAVEVKRLKKKINIEYYEYETLVPVVIPLSEIFKIENRIVTMTRQHLLEMIIDNHERLTYDAWKGKKNIPVEGLVVYDSGDNFIEVDVNGTTCRMYSENWVKKEQKFLYKKGKQFWLQIISVTGGNGRPHCKITLSRRSVNLPALLLKELLPTHKFKCHKRWPGDMSWISTDACVYDKNVIDARLCVSRELSGERLILKNKFLPGEIGKGHQKYKGNERRKQ